MNNCCFIGRLTADPELKSTANGIFSCAFTLAVARKMANADGTRDADFIRCIAWRKNADFLCKYFKKGNTLGLTGELQVRKYTDKSGQERIASEIIVHSFSFAGEKTETSTQFAYKPPAPQSVNHTPSQFVDDDDDLPF